MNTLFKNLGVIVLLIGVVILAVSAINEVRNNTFLAIGLITVFLGLVVHIFLNKKFE